MNPPSLWLALAKIAFQRQLTYRFANWSGLFTNAFFLFFRAYALRACYAHRSEIGGLDAGQVVTYATVSQALLMVIPQWGRVGVADAVRSGQIAVQLSRPLDFVGAHLAQRAGVSAYYVLVRMLPLLALGAMAGLLEPPGDVPGVIAFLASVVLAAWIAETILLLVELSSFWLGSEVGVRWLVVGLANLFSGLILPLSFFPEPMRALSRFLPFEQTLYAPTRIWIGDLGGSGAAAGAPQAFGLPDAAVGVLLLQLLWALLLTGLAQAMFHAGRPQVEVRGG